MFRAVVALVSFCTMEPVAYLAHRFVMHGPGVALHRSHHRSRQRRWEANDAFPAAFAALVLGAMALGYQVDGLGVLVPVGVGISAYGIIYALVHDVYIHRRVRLMPRRWARRMTALERLADAHRIHHLYGGEPYGMLVPIVPTALRARAEPSDRDSRHRVAG